MTVRHEVLSGRQKHTTGGLVISRRPAGALVHKQQNSDTGVKYETRFSFGETGLSLNRALVRTERGMRKATAKLEIKKHIKSPLYGLREVKERDMACGSNKIPKG